MSRRSREAEEAIRACRVALNGRHRNIQCFVVADLLATFLAGHPDFQREDALAEVLELVERLVVIDEEERFGEDGHPANTGGSTRQ